MKQEQGYKKMEAFELTDEKYRTVNCGVNEIEISECNKVLVKLRFYSESQMQNDFGSKKPIIKDF